MNATHPLKQLLRNQGRSVAWLARQLDLHESSLHDRLSGRRGGAGKRGPELKAVDPTKLSDAARQLGIDTSTLGGWVHAAAERRS